MKIQKIWNENDVPYVATSFARQLDKSKNIVTTSDQDRVYVYDGREGVGKSTLAMQHAFYIDNQLELDNIVFSVNEFKDRIRNLPKYRAVIWDEAFKGLSSKGALSRINRDIVTLLQECRQRNLFIFIVLPTIFLLEKYAAIFRSNALIHAAEYRTNHKLRYYRVYNYKNKKLLYLLGKKLYDYSKPRIKKSYRFYGKLPPTIDKDAYLQKKHDAFKNLEPEASEERKDAKLVSISMEILKEMGLNQQDIADRFTQKGLSMHQSTISRRLKSHAP